MVVYQTLVQEPLMLNLLELSLLLAGFLVEGIVIGFIMPRS
jgi:cytochrome c oxidase assembly factor CtaG